MSVPLVPLVATDLGAGPGALGILFSIATTASLIGTLPAGRLVTRLGSRSMMFVALGLTSASCFFLFVSPTMVSLLIGFSLVELGRSIFVVSSQTHAGALPAAGDVSVNFGRYGVAAAVGQLLGPAAAGIIMDTMGSRYTWLVMGGLCLGLCATLCHLIGRGYRLPPGQGTERARREGSPKHPGLRRFFTFHAVLGILASVIIVFTVGMRRIFYPIYVRQLGYTASMIGLMLSVRALTSVLARLFIMPISRLLGGRQATLLICMFALAVGLGTIPWCRGIPGLIINSILIGLGLGLAMPLSQATVFESVDSSERGLALGVRLTGNRLAQLFNPLLFGLLTQWFGISVSFWSGGALLLAVSLSVLLMVTRRSQRPG